ncbi:MAG: HD domain-containing protein, partial [Bacteroidota bacterium]
MEVPAEILQATEAYAKNILLEEMNPNYQYHSPEHTFQVVDMVEEIGSKSSLKSGEIQVLILAAWLHDLGYMEVYDGHEAVSMTMATEFLKQQNLSDDIIEVVVNLIEATRLDQEPRNLLEKVIKDADLYNLSTPDALDNSEKIRWEWKFFTNREFSDEGWDEFNYNFFNTHEYYTDYGKEILEPLKQEHVKRLKKRIKKRKRKEEEAAQAIMAFQLEEKESEIEKLKRKLKKSKQQRPDRGIETMFRTTYRTHINLSDLADSK